MSAIFQRPVCEMGPAYDFSYRPLIGDADPGSGGPCDDRPHRVDLLAASADSGSESAAWRAFSLCPEHETQLRSYDQRLVLRGVGSRFRVVGGAPGIARPAHDKA